MRRKACKKCGAVFETDGWGAYLCPACAAASRQASVYRERTCIDCGAAFGGYPKSKRCPACQAAANRKSKAAYYRTGPARKIGSTDICECCGGEYTVMGGLQRYCPSCAPTAVRANVRRHKRQYNADNVDRFAPQKAANRSYNKVCTICGKVFDADTNTVTCSPACAKRLRHLRYARSDFRRGDRKTPPENIEEENSDE